MGVKRVNLKRLTSSKLTFKLTFFTPMFPCSIKGQRVCVSEGKKY